MSNRFNDLWQAYHEGRQDEYNAAHPMFIPKNAQPTSGWGVPRTMFVVALPFLIVLTMFGLALIEVPVAEYFVEILSPAWEVQ